MRNLIFCLILSCIIGCTSDRYRVTKNGRQTVILEGEEHRAYVTDYEELRALRPPYLEYVGTKDDYHIVFWWAKPPPPLAVVTFAVPKDQFVPAQPFKFNGIKSYTPPQRLFDWSL